MPSETNVTADSQVSRIFEWRRGFNAMHLIDLGIRLGLFKAFAETPDVTAQEVADRLGLHAPYVEVWCTTAYGFELLDADQDRRFHLAPFINEILANASHPRYLGGYVQLGTQFATEDYRLAQDAFRTGATAPFQNRSHEFAQVIAQAIAGVNVMVARKILPALSGVAEVLNNGGKLLEVGCGTGNLQIQIATAFPNAHCTGVDIDPTGLAAAREAVQKAEMDHRITVLEGDVGHIVSEGDYDVVIMVEVLHEIAPDIRADVVRGCARALRTGGWLVIVDETYPSTLEETRKPEFLFPLQTGLEEMMWGNIIPTREEQKRLLNDAGFTGTINRSMLGEGFTLLSAQKQ
ncbi:MAG: methyltransferase domain-containing protein [Gammaproteobacteria bacterium]|nr:methyltransferase domain-containing protein [Gammaproteobacteria bacterium]